ncbi:MAG: nuclease-related domain-containing protein [Gammaproteobacteria bacterium]|jgi:hypothetical protein
MPDPLLNPLTDLPLNEQLQLLIPTGLLVMLGLYFLCRTPLRDWFQERRIARATRRLGARRMKNLRLPDGVDGEVLIDYLLLGREAILVVSVKRYDGLIFGGERTDQWTQVINNRSYKFPNPDQHLRRQVNAVRLLAPDAPVTGVHLFTSGARFPKDRPASVILMEEINGRPRYSDIPAPLRAAWETLVAACA